MSKLVISKKKIIQLSIPTIISLSSSTVMGLVSLWIIGFLGYEQVAIVGLVNIFCQNVILILVSMMHQITVIVSKKSLLDNKNEINTIIRNGIMAVFIFTLPILILIILNLPIIMKVLGFTEELAHMGHIYFTIRIASIFFISLARVLLGALRGLEKMKSAMYATISVNILNVVLSYITVKFYNLGLTGLGISIVISEVFQFIILYIILRRNGYLLFLNKIKGINFQNIRTLYFEGIKIGLQDIGVALTMFFFSAFAARVGVKELAATEVVLNILSFSYLPGIAIGIIASTEVAKVRGSLEKDKYNLLIELKNNLLLCTALFTLPIAFVMGAFGENIASIFMDDIETIKMASNILSIVMFLLIFDAFQMVMMDATRGFEDNTGLVIIALGLGILFFAPFSYFVTFVLNFGLVGTWISFYIYIILQFAILYRKYIMESRKYKN